MMSRDFMTKFIFATQQAVRTVQTNKQTDRYNENEAKKED